jgi:hypothetical protein
MFKNVLAKQLKEKDIESQDEHQNHQEKTKDAKSNSRKGLQNEEISNNSNNIEINCNDISLPELNSIVSPSDSFRNIHTYDNTIPEESKPKVTFIG